METPNTLGTLSIDKLLIKQAVPASIGFLVMSIYMIVDTIFVGQWVGSLAIAAITVVMPISFLISSVGMAIGIGGASIISRALGANNDEFALQTFGNQITMTLTIAIFFVILGFIFDEQILLFFGAQGDIMPHAKTYFNVLLGGVPFLAWAMMSNSVIRAEGFSKVAMNVMLIPALINLVLDPILIVVFDLGLAGAGYATVFSYMVSASYTLRFFLQKRGKIQFQAYKLTLKWEIVKEIGALGGVSLARQGTISLLTVILNYSLYKYGGELYVAVFGIVNRMTMFSLFPIMGLTQGFLPIAGFNYGAKNYERVREVIKKSIMYGTIISVIICLIIISLKTTIVQIFTTDEFLLTHTPDALMISFLGTPVILMQLIGSAYFQAIGKAFPALMLTITKQGFCLIPLILILPIFYGIDGIWWAFPISDVVASAVNFFFLAKARAKLA